jgi:mRNA-degrading endonuclease RelE of RelBE toxin-antitoxin system
LRIAAAWADLSAVVEYKILLKAYVAAKIEAIEPKSERENVRRRIAGMIGDPKPGGAKPVPGYSDRFRVRMGSHRIVYQVDTVRRELTIVAVRYRNRRGPPECSTIFEEIEPVE